MARAKQNGTTKARSDNGIGLGFEEKLLAAADRMRGHMDSPEYKHVALGLIFLKYISDAFQKRYDALKAEPHADPELFGAKDHRSKDILGQVYEYFLGKFASAEGKAGGEFYTPQSVVRLLVEMIEPYKGRVFDPCCGSGGMCLQSEKLVEARS